MEAPSLNEDQVLAGIVAVLDGTLATDEPHRSVAAFLLALMPAQLLSRPRDAARAASVAAEWVLEGAPTPKGVSLTQADLAFGQGIASAGAYVKELAYRALFGVRAARRMATAAFQGKFDAQRNKEEATYQAHKKAAKERETRMSVLDDAVRRWGDLLSWRAVIDDRTTPECLNANGKNFRVSRPPTIGLPGLGPHPRCRCVPGPSIEGAEEI